MSPNFSLDTGHGACDILPELKGSQMRTVREVNGLTQVQVATMLGISQSYLAQLEAGDRRISRRTAIAFAAVINQHKAKRQAKTA